MGDLPIKAGRRASLTCSHQTVTHQRVGCLPTSLLATQVKMVHTHVPTLPVGHTWQRIVMWDLFAPNLELIAKISKINIVNIIIQNTY